MSKILIIMSLGITALIWFIYPNKTEVILGSQASQVSDTKSLIQKFNHKWGQILNKHVDLNGNVNYLRLSKENKQISELLNLLGALDTSTLKDDLKLASHINFYNFLTIAGILHFYPLKSIRDKVSPFGFNFWKDLRFQFFDTTLTLDQIEHEILRGMNEPRIHFAIVCASISCPKLLNQVYDEVTINEQLSNQSRAFFNNKKHIVWNHENKMVRLSGIMYWFREDFGASDENILKFLWQYLSEDIKAKVENLTDYQIGPALQYDWGLNEQAKLSN